MATAAAPVATMGLCRVPSGRHQSMQAAAPVRSRRQQRVRAAAAPAVEAVKAPTSAADRVRLGSSDLMVSREADLWLACHA